MNLNIDHYLLEHRVTNGPRSRNGESFLWGLLDSIISNPDDISRTNVVLDEYLKTILELHPFPDLLYAIGFVIVSTIYKSVSWVMLKVVIQLFPKSEL